jgi:hypothetical protein
MLGLTDWLSILKLVLQFPGQVLALAKLIQGTPEERREAIMKQIQAETDAIASGGRPQWD